MRVSKPFSKREIRAIHRGQQHRRRGEREIEVAADRIVLAVREAGTRRIEPAPYLRPPARTAAGRARVDRGVRENRDKVRRGGVEHAPPAPCRVPKIETQLKRRGLAHHPRAGEPVAAAAREVRGHSLVPFRTQHERRLLDRVKRVDADRK
jgi:hypothetical protein